VSAKTQSDKAEQRAEIEKQLREFLGRGGAVEEVARGTSGRDGMSAAPNRFQSFTPRQKEERTYVPEVVAAIEARRRKPKAPPKSGAAAPKQVRKPVYDDFGEPVRYEWVETDSSK